MELIVACTHTGIIGDGNKMLWNIPEDMKQFREKTLSHIVVMGRKTFESIGNKPLKNRINVVLSNTIPETDITSLFQSAILSEKLEQTVLFARESNIDLLLAELTKREARKIFIIGGSEIYKRFYKHCFILHFTVISLDLDGDTKFPYDFSEIEKDFTKITETDWLHSKTNSTPYKFISYRAGL